MMRVALGERDKMADESAGDSGERQVAAGCRTKATMRKALSPASLITKHIGLCSGIIAARTLNFIKQNLFHCIC
ncbi:hypothetical protein EB796_006611 [Bugula neritina]|uniref:Uncharacterized protein n=1 Tax=Bugula neritina TaxID=10212 RepID=A0A7J7K8V7_BUGNE|nr:hypothetical protein EB796_006611 [Bugula neritina]